MLLSSQLKPTQSASGISALIFVLLHLVIIGKSLTQKLHRRLFQVELINMILRKQCNPRRSIAFTFALNRFQCTHHQFDQGGFSHAIGSNHGNSRIAVQDHVDIGEQHLVHAGILEIDLFHDTDGLLQLTHVGEHKRELLVCSRRLQQFGLVFQLLQDLALRLDHRRHLLALVLVFGDPLLDVLDLFLDRFVRFHLFHQAKLRRPHHRIVITAIIQQFHLTQMNGPITHCVQKGSIVRHHDHCLFIAFQVVLQPQHSGKIQVIRRFVQ
mmetsp:Transcript_10391/g.16780  ORF Transcript_10391/g.16780 Transcript_10391/m.16780 type:complete len:268 (+) Transcript_10391:534-1337(+)